MDPGTAGLSALATNAAAQGIQNNITSPSGTSGSASTLTFNGTLADLQSKDPQAYMQLVLMPLAYAIVQQCQDDNQHYIDTIKENEKDS
jgi:hypothetical protein